MSIPLTAKKETGLLAATRSPASRHHHLPGLSKPSTTLWGSVFLAIHGTPFVVMKFIDLTGRKFGRLTVVRKADSYAAGKIKWVCKCDCGNEKEVLANNLRSGHTNSCGCIFKTMNIRHGHSRTVRGGKDSPEYRAWTGMKDRTHGNKTTRSFYPHYEGRGITMCERWEVFENFLADMGPKPSPKHSVDRIDNNKGYGPDNCRWATCKEQARNTRRNVYLTYEGRTECLSEWASILGLKIPTIHYRLKRGLSVKQAFEMKKCSRQKAV